MIYPDNIKKYSGTITKTKKKYTLRYKTKSRLFTIKEYLIENYNSDEDTLKEIQKYQKKWAIANNLVKNKYEIVKTDSEEYIKLYIKDNIYSLIDLDDINYVDKYIWHLKSKSDFITTTDKEFNSRITFHELKYGHNNIIHLNNNKLDNRSFNIQLNENKEEENLNNVSVIV